MDRILLQPVAANPETTPAALGESILKALSAISGGQSDFAGTFGPAILTSGEQDALLLCSSEMEVVKFITPFLWDIRGAGDKDESFGGVLVNSENNQWLDNSANPLSPNLRLKPDLFSSWRPFVIERTRSERQGEGSVFCYGVLAHRLLQRDGAVRELYEAKFNRNLTNADFGELVEYHRLIPGLCRGMLFNQTQFWLYSSFDGHPSKLVRSVWTKDGSHGLVREFFEVCREEPPLLVALRALTSTLSVRLSSNGTIFLGAGGSGRVFLVERITLGNAQPGMLALKVVVGEHPSLLANEFQAMSAAQHLYAPVVPVVAGSLRLLNETSGGYLLSEVGTVFELTGLNSCIMAFASLQALHALRVMHGDARLPNLLKMPDGKLAWIDLVRGVVGMFEGSSPLITAFIQADATDLACSVLGCSRGAAPQSVTIAVAAYDGTSTSAKNVASVVWEMRNS